MPGLWCTTKLQEPLEPRRCCSILGLCGGTKREAPCEGTRLGLFCATETEPVATATLLNGGTRLGLVVTLVRCGTRLGLPITTLPDLLFGIMLGLNSALLFAAKLGLVCATRLGLRWATKLTEPLEACCGTRMGLLDGLRWATTDNC